MKILNLHGYKGCSKNSARKALEELGHEVIAPDLDYDALTVAEVMEKLERIIAAEHIRAVVGTSYGGFFAALICVRFRLPTVLVNPCLMPFLHLPRLGSTRNVRAYMPFFAELSDIDLSLVSTIIGGNDEVIDTHDFTKNLLYNERFAVHQRGKHSGATLPLRKFFKAVLPNEEV